MTYSDADEQQHVSGWAVGAIAFAGSLMVMIGSFSVVAGLAAIFDDGYIIVSQRYAFDLDVTAWGWIHLVLGIAVVAVGIGLFMSKTWAGRAAIVLAVLIAIDFFFFIPYAPFWSVLVIALSVWLIWAVTRVSASARGD
ncbi:hypothetical protein EV652_112168 [Kribbella steppae]|uniref:DUF7144 domain-containing protein n=1 Tax=Kribbella steppae TaxID=2512223 RepID=A0A4R2H4B9_9ACTN|nr:hypothetical protein [Kribbella steppae]TCO20422.1 hypothetical protein EV652_112168 [Kribbella steppae]